jgi:hypothetical protein
MRLLAVTKFQLLVSFVTTPRLTGILTGSTSGGGTKERAMVLTTTAAASLFLIRRRRELRRLIAIRGAGGERTEQGGA